MWESVWSEWESVKKCDGVRGDVGKYVRRSEKKCGGRCQVSVGVCKKVLGEVRGSVGGGMGECVGVWAEVSVSGKV